MRGRTTGELRAAAPTAYQAVLAVQPSVASLAATLCVQALLQSWLQGLPQGSGRSVCYYGCADSASGLPNKGCTAMQKLPRVASGLCGSRSGTARFKLRTAAC